MDDELERLRELTAKVLSNVRTDYLKTGAAGLTLYDRLQARMRSAAGRCESPQEWISELLRGLQIQSPSSWTSSASVDLVREIQDCGLSSEWLRMVESESGYLIALVRLDAEERREVRVERARKQREWDDGPLSKSDVEDEEGVF